MYPCGHLNRISSKFIIIFQSDQGIRHRVQNIHRSILLIDYTKVIGMYNEKSKVEKVNRPSAQYRDCGWREYVCKSKIRLWGNQYVQGNIRYEHWRGNIRKQNNTCEIQWKKSKKLGIEAVRKHRIKQNAQRFKVISPVQISLIWPCKRFFLVVEFIPAVSSYASMACSRSWIVIIVVDFISIGWIWKTIPWL